MLAYLFQATIKWVVDLNLFVQGALIPAVAFEPEHIHRLISAAWLHADLFHLLGNVLVILLVGVPLEQRLGRGRFLSEAILGGLWQIGKVGHFVSVHLGPLSACSVVTWLAGHEMKLSSPLSSFVDGP